MLSVQLPQVSKYSMCRDHIGHCELQGIPSPTSKEGIDRYLMIKKEEIANIDLQPDSIEDLERDTTKSKIFLSKKLYL